MSIGILGRKVGMTQIFNEDRKLVPVTVIQIEPTYVVQKKTQEKDGYQAVKIGAVTAKKANKPLQGQFKVANIAPVKVMREVRVDNVEAVDVGDRVLLDSFDVGDFVNITTKSIGKGFQGVIKRHGFAGGPMSHGSGFRRRPGSIGSKAGGKGCRKKVMRGRALPGQTGNRIVTIQNLQIVDIDLENGLMVVKGSIAGSAANILYIINSFKKSPAKEWKVSKVQEEVVANVIPEVVESEGTDSQTHNAQQFEASDAGAVVENDSVQKNDNES